MSKVIELSEYSKGVGKTSCVVIGHFSTIHPGHIDYLKHAGKIYDEVIVFVDKCSEDDKQGIHIQQNQNRKFK